MTNKQMISTLEQRGILTGHPAPPLQPGEVIMGSLPCRYSLSWELEAPAGQVWKALGVHQLVTEGPTEKNCLEDLLNSSAYGLEPCDNAECEWCHPELDEI